MDEMIINLSGGNQQKVIIGRVLLSNPKILLLDDPTKGIDVGAKLEIYNIIKELEFGLETPLAV
jgi:ABC-type sugar transport system ATPase subunit